MADLSDVQRAIVGVIADGLFPAPYLSGALAPSNVGTPIKLYYGWPESKQLATDLAAGNAHVSVFPLDGMTRRTSRYPFNTFITSANAATVTATAVGSVVTIGGTITAGNVVGVQFGTSALTAAYAYPVVASDTTTSIAANLAAQIPGAAFAGPLLTLPSAPVTGAAVMVPQQAFTETRRQEQGIRVSCWCPTPAARDAICSLIDAGFANLQDAFGNFTQFFPLSDGSVARLLYLRTTTNDIPERDKVWRRDLLYCTEYATTLIQLSPSVLFAGGTVTVPDDVVVTYFGAESP